MTALPPDVVADLRQENARLQAENARLFNETKEALARQTATSDILRVISQSPTDVQPVFDAIVLTAARLLRCDRAFIQRCEAGSYWTVASAGLEGPRPITQSSKAPIDPEANFPSRAILAKKTLHLPDWSAIELPAFERHIRELHGINSALFMPLLREGECIGLLAMTGKEAGMFGESEIALAESFRDQALIAIENTRLFNETKEALERQTVTADILRVIASSPSDTTPVFEAIATSATRLLGGFSAAVFRFLDGSVHLAAFTSVSRAADAALKADFPKPVDEFEGFRLAEQGKPFPIADTEEIPHRPELSEIARLHGFRSMLFVPLMNGGVPIGIISVTRREPGAFSPNHIQLLQTFADQAVIAIENARLFNETQEALERQNATAEILRTIAAAPGDAGRSLQQIAETSARLFGAPSVSIQLVKDGEWSDAYRFGDSAQRIRAAVPLAKIRVGGRNLPGAVAGENRQIHIPDLDHLDASLADFPGLPHARAAGTRTMCGTPLRREGKAIGALIIYRDQLLPFTQEELALQQSFADQAVIAIENARLFNETREALERQTATADILKVIASSPSDVQPVFEAIVGSAAKLFEPCAATIVTLRDEKLHWKATAVLHPEFDVERAKAIYPLPFKPDHFPSARATAERRIVEIPDSEAADTSDTPRQAGRISGFRSATFVPLINGAQGIGTIILTHPQAGFRLSEKQLALVQTFADQAVIAIENARLFNETQEALERQTATAEILKVIASSPNDVQPVFDVIVERAVRLCGARMGRVYRYDNGMIHMVAGHNLSTPGLSKVQEVFPRPAADDTTAGLAIRSRQPYFVTDIESDQSAPPLSRQMIEALGTRSQVTVPMLRSGEPIGAITVGWAEPAAYGDQPVLLLQTFADQAVIAIENVRLFNETKEALERQTATADILKVIASSPSDVQPVFDAIATSANRLIGGFSTAVFRFFDGSCHLAAFTPTNPAADEVLKSTFPLPLTFDSAPFQKVLKGETVQIADTEMAEEVTAKIARARGFRSNMFCPLISSGTVIGMITITRVETGSFAPHHVHLLQTFADQAVIAIENVRLFNETQEALERQTATADILKVIASSPSDVQPVFEAIATSANRLIGGFSSTVFRFIDGIAHLKAFTPTTPAADEVLQSTFPRPVADFPPFKMAQAGEVSQIPDTETLSDEILEIARARGFRSMLFTPLMNDGVSIGFIAVTRIQPGAFADHHVQLLQTFADQAVIAIENVRLFDEVQAKTRDLTEALTHQTGSANILKVIASSPTDVEPVLKAIVESACELCEADDAVVHLREGDDLRSCAHHGPIPVGMDRRPINRNFASGRAAVDKVAIHIHDVLSSEGYDLPEAQEMSRRVGIRTVLSVPLLRENESIGTILLRRTEVNPFSDKQIALLQTFADQAVIAIGNVRLFDEVQARTRELSQSLDDLRTAQDRLVQTEKLASLGQLTAGIAHEIKNPLNFVNNFSALSAELTDELNDLLKSAVLTGKLREEVDELTGMLKDNLQKVVQHGKRADSIVKNMLLHSREGSGEHRPTDINAILDESLNLAYHGARAEKREFNVTLQRDFDERAGTIEVFPQEITRVFLNLISNGFYAVTKRKTENGGSDFEPVVRATTRSLGDTVEIRIRDNGTGIPAEVKEKMFNPFFTTKPAGEGTGLGLSMSHDIIVKQHGGRIDVETAPGEFTEFRIVLPRTKNLSDKNRGQT
jgi:GAF domain-containing protein